ncbi:hypothetical protein HA402_013485 [Bradysia odoriphaga]|nr:hypothetical protein HA402_013485 [Bradysia odoriphaga]
MLNRKDFPSEMSNAALKKIITAKSVEFCAKDMKPFEIVAGEGFRSLIQHTWSLGAFYGNKDVGCILPHPTTISRNVSSIKEQKEQQILPVIENAIKNMECSATTDMWTETHRQNHFLTMTSHYFDANLRLKRKVLFTAKFKAKIKSGRNIMGELKKRFKKMKFDPKLLRKVTFVTDQGSNMVKALKRPFKRINCRAHLLSTILRNTFSSDDLPLIILKTLTRCKKIVRYLKQSGKINELSKCVVQDCGTRWNYKLDMIKSVIDLYSEIIPLLTPTQRITWNIDIELGNEMILFLQPFKDACKSMEGDTYPTANKILLWYAELSDHLNEDNFDRNLNENNSDEFELYMRTADYSLYNNENDKKHLVELFWAANQTRFPKLYNQVRKHLHVPASSGSSERVFSDAGRTMEPRRTNLQPDVLDDLLFIRDHFH